jgi:hypothetical protein
MSKRADALATRLEQGAAALAAFAEGMTDAEWRSGGKRIDKRPFGVIVHHVASMYPIEIDLARTAAAGKPIAVTWDAVNGINAKHATEHASVGKREALDLLRKNSAAAAAAIRTFTDAQLDTAVPNGLSFDAPLTTQFWIEDHPVRHSFHHLARMREALGR